jgi:hypothetical protein
MAAGAEPVGATGAGPDPVGVTAVGDTAGGHLVHSLQELLSALQLFQLRPTARINMLPTTIITEPCPLTNTCLITHPFMDSAADAEGAVNCVPPAEFLERDGAFVWSFCAAAVAVGQTECWRRVGVAIGRRYCE